MNLPPKPRVVYAQGRFVPIEEASVPIMDRGFLFGDGIYEVTAILDGHFVDNAPHLARLERSLAAIGIRNPHSAEQWTEISLPPSRGEMKPNPFDSLYHLTRPLILEDILTPVAHQVIDRKRVELNVWTQKKGGISDSAW